MPLPATPPSKKGTWRRGPDTVTDWHAGSYVTGIPHAAIPPPVCLAGSHLTKSLTTPQLQIRSRICGHPPSGRARRERIGWPRITATCVPANAIAGCQQGSEPYALNDECPNESPEWQEPKPQPSCAVRRCGVGVAAFSSGCIPSSVSGQLDTCAQPVVIFLAFHGRITHLG
jgi:hypothetical protein